MWVIPCTILRTWIDEWGEPYTIWAIYNLSEDKGYYMELPTPIDYDSRFWVPHIAETSTKDSNLYLLKEEMHWEWWVIKHGTHSPQPRYFDQYHPRAED